MLENHLLEGKKNKWFKIAKIMAMTHSKPMKEVGSKKVLMVFGSHFVRK